MFLSLKPRLTISAFFIIFSSILGWSYLNTILDPSASKSVTVPYLNAYCQDLRPNFHQVCPRDSNDQSITLQTDNTQKPFTRQQTGGGFDIRDVKFLERNYFYSLDMRIIEIANYIPVNNFSAALLIGRFLTICIFLIAIYVLSRKELYVLNDLKLKLYLVLLLSYFVLTLITIGANRGVGLIDSTLYNGDIESLIIIYLKSIFGSNSMFILSSEPRNSVALISFLIFIFYLITNNRNVLNMIIFMPFIHVPMGIFLIIVLIVVPHLYKGTRFTFRKLLWILIYMTIHSLSTNLTFWILIILSIYVFTLYQNQNFIFDYTTYLFFTTFIVFIISCLTFIFSEYILSEFDNYFVITSLGESGSRFNGLMIRMLMWTLVLKFIGINLNRGNLKMIEIRRNTV
jgi:hypothetical protein